MTAKQKDILAGLLLVTPLLVVMAMHLWSYAKLFWE